jgi:hypothetical protein
LPLLAAARHGLVHGRRRRMLRPRFPKENQIGLAAGIQYRNNTVAEPVYLVQDALDYRKFLKTRNHTTVNLSKRFVKL